MVAFKKESLKFDGINYDSWKEKMKTHMLCIDPKLWQVTVNKKTMIREDEIDSCEKIEKDLFM